MSKQPGRTGAEELRIIVRNMDYMDESFNDEFSADQLLQIGRMMLACEWDIYPDQWDERQVKEALEGYPPHFAESSTRLIPIYKGQEGYPHERKQ